MARRLIHHGHEVVMVCGTYGGGQTGLNTDFVHGRREGLVDGIHVIEFDLAYSNSDGFLKRTLTFLKFSLRSIGLIFSQKYDVIFATTTPLTAGIPGIIGRWLRKKPFVFEVRDLWPELPREMGVITNPIVLKLMSFLEWASYRSATRNIGLSPGIVNGIEKMGVNKSRIELIPNGCDLEIFQKTSEPWKPSSVNDNDLLVIYTGTHGIANGLDSVLSAAEVLQQRGRDDIKIVMVGQGKLKKELEDRSLKMGLNNITFHPPVNKQQLADLMSSADLGMQLLANVPAFYYGTSPNKFFDYISAGLPVLNNYPGWLADMINENDCGFAVPPDNPEAFADALEAAANDRSRLKVMGDNAKTLAQKSFDRAKLADKWVSWVSGAAK